MSRISCLAIALALSAALCSVSAAHLRANPAGSQCPSSCSYTLTNPENGEPMTYDLSSLCKETQYTGTDSVGHTYFANICGFAQQDCVPATWKNTYTTGFAIQMWGSAPKNSSYTKDCQVLGHEFKNISFTDPSDYRAGITVLYQGAPAASSDPFWCTFNPATGAQYARHAKYNIACDPSVDTAVLDYVSQNSTNDCFYSFQFRSKYGCPGAGMCGEHGQYSNGKCTCEHMWTGKHCDQFTGKCGSTPRTCNTCKACCQGYSTATCEGCVANECKLPVCSATKSCTACAACCVDWIKTEADCEKCVEHECPSNRLL